MTKWIILSTLLLSTLAGCSDDVDNDTIGSDGDADTNSDADADSDVNTDSSVDTSPPEDPDSNNTDAGCSYDSDCADGTFCELALCNVTPPTGECIALPQMCTMIYSPVCGCDGIEYSNECMAWSSGISTAPDTECNQQ